MDPGLALHHLGGVDSYAQLKQLCSKRRLRDSLQRGEVVRLARGRCGGWARRLADSWEFHP